MSVFYKVYCPSDIVKGDVLSYNETTLLWERATSPESTVGIARTDAVVRNSGFSVELVLSGFTEAKASRSIPTQGGNLHLENGQVYVDNSTKGLGVICPQLIDDSTERNAGDLVFVILG